MKITKLAYKPAFNVGPHHRHASETPFKWRFAGGPMMARLKWYLDPAYPHQNLKKKKNEKKNVVIVRVCD